MQQGSDVIGEEMDEKNNNLKGGFDLRETHEHQSNAYRDTKSKKRFDDSHSGNDIMSEMFANVFKSDSSSCDQGKDMQIVSPCIMVVKDYVGDV